MTQPPQPPPGAHGDGDYALRPPAPAPWPPAPPPPHQQPPVQPYPPQQPYQGGQSYPPQQPYQGGQPYPPQGGQSPYGYGHPQQPPHGGQIPYGSTGGPQPPYGYQQFAPPAPNPPVGPAKRRSTGRVIGLVAGAVALVLVVGGGIWLATRGAGPTPQAHGGGSGATSTGTDSNGTGTGTGSGQGGTPTADDGTGHRATGQVRWTVKHAAVPRRTDAYATPGLWFDGGHVVKQTPTGVAAYDTATGRTAWTATAPDGYTCQSSQTVADHAVALSYGTHCQDVMAVDLTTGRVRWHQALPGAASDQAYVYQDLDLAVSGTTVALAWDDQSVAYSLTDGHREWAAGAGGSCQDTGFAGGIRLVEVYKCGYGMNPPYHVRVIDPRTGKGRWTWNAPANTQISNVISVDPVVVGIAAGQNGVTDLWDVEGGTLRGKIPLGVGSDGQSRYGVHCPLTLTPCTDALVAGGTLYLTSQPNPGGKGGGPINRVAAFDLATGDPAWLSQPSSEVLDLVAVDGDCLLTYREPPIGGTGALVKVRRANGALTTWTTMSTATENTEQTAYLPTLDELAEGWYHGTLYLGLSQVDSHDTLTPYQLAALR